MKMSKLYLVSFTLVWCLLGAIVVQGFTYDDKEVETEEGKSAMFERWRSHHNLEGVGPAEKKKQYENFKATLEHVHKTNKANLGFTLEMNRFAGMSKEEFKSKHMGFKGTRKNPGGGQKLKLFSAQSGFRYSDVKDLPPAFDWRPKGAITPVKNQGNCASCYAFAAADAVEGLHFVQTGELLTLSAQEIVDCNPHMACNGGWLSDSYIYIEKHGGLTTEKNYPYNAAANPCNVQKESDIAVQVGGHELIPAQSEEDIMKALINQPLSVHVKVEDDMMSYKEGILSSPCGTATDHCVLLVGYDTAPDGTPYWVVKNSWGDTWGEKGYMKLLRGVPGDGYCGIATGTEYPVPYKTNTEKPANEPMVHGSLKPRARDL